MKAERTKIKEQIDAYNDSVEDKVLDSELFVREAKQYILS